MYNNLIRNFFIFRYLLSIFTKIHISWIILKLLTQIIKMNLNLPLIHSILINHCNTPNLVIIGLNIYINITAIKLTFLNVISSNHLCITFGAKFI